MIAPKFRIDIPGSVINEMAALYEDRQWAIPQLAAHFGFHPNVVRLRLKAVGVELRPPRHQAPYARPRLKGRPGTLTRDECEAIRILGGAGWSASRLEKLIRRKKRHIIAALRAQGFDAAPNLREYSPAASAEIWRLRDAWSYRALARQFGGTHKTIQTHLARLARTQLRAVAA